MPVKIGSSYVSEAAYSYAKAQAEENSEGSVLKSLSEKFPNLKFSVGTAPFSGAGLNNVSISPKILREMENNPDKKIEYEALIYDIANLNPTRNSTVQSAGFIIGDDGGLRGWSISKSGDDSKRHSTALNKKDKKFWWEKILDKPDKKITEAAEIDLSEEKTKGKVAFNQSKRARQLAAANSADDVKFVLSLLETDLSDCEEGVKNEMCDEDEVKKVKAMIERAQQKMNEVSGENKNIPAQGNFSPVDVLI